MWLSTMWKRAPLAPMPAVKDFRVIVILFSLFSSTLILVATFNVHPSDVQCARHSYPWFPAYDMISHAWRTFAEADKLFIQSPYSGHPTEYLEAAWEGLIPKHPLAISSEHLQALNLSQYENELLRLPSNKSKVIAMPAVFVELSCLNLLRQHTYRSSYDYSALPAFQGDEARILKRREWCLERIRDSITCWGDVTPQAKVLQPNAPSGWMGATLHYCRDFDAISEWTERQARVEVSRLAGGWLGGVITSHEQ